MSTVVLILVMRLKIRLLLFIRNKLGADMAAPQKLIKLEGVVVDSKGGYYQELRLW